MILWITSDHIAWLWATGIAIDVGYGDAIQVVTMLVRPHLSDLFSTVLFVLGHVAIVPNSAISDRKKRSPLTITHDE